MVRTVAVIGAGASGLAAVKCCLEEGLEPTCFERSGYIGGLWHYTETIESGRTSVSQTTIANISKEMMCYSDFPPPREFAPFMHHTEVDAYFQLYADRFNLYTSIKLNTEVVRVTEAPDHVTTGKWTVVAKDTVTGDVQDRTFDAVLLCTGLYVKPTTPAFPGVETFGGKIIHAQQYREPSGYRGQRVLVVGIGNTAGDIAVDLSFVAAQVFISTRQGAWVHTRINKNGAPWDMVLLSRFSALIGKKFPNFANKHVSKQLNGRFDHSDYSLQPTHSPLQTNGLVNDEIPYRIMCGRIKVKSNIRRFTTNGVECDDDSVIENLDAVIMSTGYTPDFPYLESDVIGEDKRELFMGIFPPIQKHYTCAVVGATRLRGPVVPIMEMQARVAARTLAGKLSLPAEDAMKEAIRRRNENQRRNLNWSMQYMIQIDYMPYMDEMAMFYGCKPNFVKMFFSSPRFALRCIFGPCCPYQYRLTGPRSWAGAREAMMTMRQRTYYPLKTRTVRGWQVPKSSGITFKLCLFVAMVAGLLYFFYR